MRLANQLNGLKGNFLYSIIVVVQLLVQFSSVAQLCPTARQDSRSPPKPMSIESLMPSNHLILCHPLRLLPSIFPNIRVFSNESTLCIRWPKYWNFSFNVSPSNEHPGLISFRIDWLDPLAVHGTLKSLLQHHSSKHQFFGAQPFHTPTLTSIHDHWKNHSLD